jgi:hypothetical protein
MLLVILYKLRYSAFKTNETILKIIIIIIG